MSIHVELPVTRMELCFRCGQAHTIKTSSGGPDGEGVALHLSPHVHFVAVHKKWNLIYAGTYCLDHFSMQLSLEELQANARARLPADKTVRYNFGYPDLPPAAQDEFKQYLALWDLEPTVDVDVVRHDGTVAGGATMTR